VSARAARGPARGFTLVEILVAMTLTLAVFAITLPFVRAQTRALGASAGRLDADQIARYAQRAIDRDLRLASADPGQPLLVYAGPLGISFNANLFAADSTDPNAADVAAGAATTLTESWRRSAAAAVPKGNRAYPPDDYYTATGQVSRNETISYFLHPDTVSARSDLYVLYRRVNARDSIQVVRALRVPADSAFFTYHRSSGGARVAIASSRLPLWWDSTAIDSVRWVSFRPTGYFRDRMTGKETLRSVSWTTTLANAAGRVSLSCGARPGTPDDAQSSKVWMSDAGPYRVLVRWDRSADDGSGENDVRYYLVERQRSGGSWTSLATVAATGALTYEYGHASPGVGTYSYGVRAIDCAQQSSTRDAASLLMLP
jgi:prepilin-type N-terminal cleavage/methylation domain-containing protein